MFLLCPNINYSPNSIFSVAALLTSRNETQGLCKTYRYQRLSHMQDKTSPWVMLGEDSFRVPYTQDTADTSLLDKQNVPLPKDTPLPDDTVDDQDIVDLSPPPRGHIICRWLYYWDTCSQSRSRFLLILFPLPSLFLVMFYGLTAIQTASFKI